MALPRRNLQFASLDDEQNFFLEASVASAGSKGAPAAEVVNTYLEPLLEDLLKLWEGVSAIDMSKLAGHRWFTM